MSKPTIRTAASRRSSTQPARSNSADQAVDIRAWAQMLVERGNRLFEQAERERVALIGTRESSLHRRSAGEAAGRSHAGGSRGAGGKETGASAKPR